MSKIKQTVYAGISGSSIFGMCSVVALLLIPCAARANQFTDASFELNRDYANVVLRSREPIDAPRLRFERGAVRASFDGIGDQPWLTPSVDGQAVRGVVIYPTSENRATVRIAVGDNRRLERKDVHVDQRNNETYIRIDRKALPEVTASQPEPKAEKAVASPQNLQAAEPPPAAQNLPPKTIPPLADNRPPLPAPASSTAKASGHPATSIFASRDDSGAEQLGKPNESNLILLVVVSLALCGIYLAIKFGFIKRVKPSKLSEIEIIGSKRLGTRHQLVLVRALGEDHLLSINAGHTERIASVPSPQLSGQADTSEREGQFSKLFSNRYKALLAGQDKGAPARDALEEDAPFPKHSHTQPYSADLLHFGKRGERSPLEQLNILEAKRANGSNPVSETHSLRNFQTG